MPTDPGVPVDDVMTKRPVSCHEEHTVWEAARMCSKKGPFRRLPVTRDGAVTGVLSIADLALVVHPMLEAIPSETEASVEEAKVVGEARLKKDLAAQVPKPGILR